MRAAAGELERGSPCCRTVARAVVRSKRTQRPFARAHRGVALRFHRRRGLAILVCDSLAETYAQACPGAQRPQRQCNDDDAGADSDPSDGASTQAFARYWVRRGSARDRTDRRRNGWDLQSVR